MSALRERKLERRRLPRGRSALPEPEVAALQRQRLLHAMAEVVAERGYAGASVASVIEGAGMSRATFYQHFPNREQCFLAAYDEIVAALLAEVAEATAAPGGWRKRIAAGLRAYLRFLTEHPAHARTFIIEVSAAGRAAGRRRQSVHARFVVLLRAIYAEARLEHPEAAPLGEHVFVAIVGALNELVARELERGRRDLRGLESAALDVELSLLGLNR